MISSPTEAHPNRDFSVAVAEEPTAATQRQGEP